MVVRLATSPFGRWTVSQTGALHSAVPHRNPWAQGTRGTAYGREIARFLRHISALAVVLKAILRKFSRVKRAEPTDKLALCGMRSAGISRAGFDKQIFGADEQVHPPTLGLRHPKLGTTRNGARRPDVGSKEERMRPQACGAAETRSTR